MTENAERIKILMVFIGLRLTHEGNKVALWVRINEDDNNGEKMHEEEFNKNSAKFDGKKLHALASPGTIISIDANSDTSSVYVGTAKIFGAWKNQDDISLWCAQHRAVEDQVETQQQAIKKLRAKLPEEVLRPFREAYQQATSRQRAHILAFVIEKITGR